MRLAPSLLLLVALASSAQEVGYRRAMVTDSTRFAGREPRQVLIQFWYPAVAGSGKSMKHGDYLEGIPAPLAHREIHAYAQQKYGATTTLDALPANVRRDATPKSGRFPVVLYAGGAFNP
ncbi:MAG TPA: hypothetical protein VF698_01025, partial [Thermoanaerobaculia bacterium]